MHKWKFFSVMILSLALLLTACGGAEQGENDTLGHAPDPKSGSDFGTPPAEDSVETAEPEAGALPETGGQGQPTEGGLENAAQWIGASIVNPQGDELGKVADIFINMATSRPDYAAVIRNETVNVAVFVPWQLFTLDDGRLVLNLENEDPLTQAVPMDLDSLNLSDPYWDEGIRQYWAPLLPEGSEPLGASQPATEATNTTPVHAPLSMLQNAPVQDLTTGEELARVGEVRYDGASGRVYAYLQAVDALQSAAPTLLVPFSAFTLSTGYQPGVDLNSPGSSGQDSSAGEAPGAVEQSNTDSLDPRPTPQFTTASENVSLLVARDRLLGAPSVEGGQGLEALDQYWQGQGGQ